MCWLCVCDRHKGGVQQRRTSVLSRVMGVEQCLGRPRVNAAILGEGRVGVGVNVNVRGKRIVGKVMWVREGWGHGGQDQRVGILTLGRVGQGWWVGR